ncbi:MAG: hypothetical protein RL711_1826, partial [Bacteroidota bacterium]
NKTANTGLRLIKKGNTWSTMPIFKSTTTSLYFENTKKKLIPTHYLLQYSVNHKRLDIKNNNIDIS